MKTGIQGFLCEQPVHPPALARTVEALVGCPTSAKL
jgi:hypothetical protein